MEITYTDRNGIPHTVYAGESFPNALRQAEAISMEVDDAVVVLEDGKPEATYLHGFRRFKGEY